MISQALVVFCFIKIIFFDSITAQSTKNCGNKYACFKQPENCQDSECDFIFKWTQKSNTSEFYDFDILARINSKLQTQSLWLAIGFSKDPYMGDDSVCMCKITQDKSSIENYYNTGKSIPILLDEEDETVALSDKIVENRGNFLRCSFKRKKNLENEEKFFDLQKEKFFILAAYGRLDSKGGIKRHLLRASTDHPINFSEVIINKGLSVMNKNLIKAHACLMVIAWIFLVSIGMSLPRYFKFIYPDYLINGLKLWFFFHRPLMYLGFITTVTSIIIIFVDQNWKWINQDQLTEFVHSIFGIILLGLMVFQILIAIFRPHQDKSYRYIFNYIHSFTGIAILIFLTITIFVGVSLERMELRLEGIAIMVGWLAWILIYISSLEFFEHIYKPNQKFDYTNTSQITYRSEYLKEVERENLKRVKLERYKITLGIIHMLSSFGFTFGLIYVISKA